ncbi:MAG: PilZ domain-containing protein [Candidatus Omnitrophica bacterium]|nr:PilZ domain-containing protein [Candidatus Omnitrophota bacterium]
MNDRLLVKITIGNFIKKNEVGYVSDLSLHGIRIKTTLKLKKADRLSLTLITPPNLPGPKELLLSAVIMRVQRCDKDGLYRVGCRLSHKERGNG